MRIYCFENYGGIILSKLLFENMYMTFNIHFLSTGTSHRKVIIIKKKI